MADIYGSHFEYGGVSSRRYGLMFAAVNEGRNVMVSGSINGVTAFNRKEIKRYLIDDDYSESPLSYDVEIVTDNDFGPTLEDRHEIERWLFNRAGYWTLYLDMADDTRGETWDLIDGEIKRLYLNARFINATRMEYNGGIVGYRATLEADSGWWWQDAITKSFTLSNASSSSSSNISVEVESDIDDYIYPKVTFATGGSGGTVQIINHADDDSRITRFIELSPAQTVTMRGGVNYVSGNAYQKMYKTNFPRLMNGSNTLTVTGNVSSISIEWNNRRML